MKLDWERLNEYRTDLEEFVQISLNWITGIFNCHIDNLTFNAMKNFNNTSTQLARKDIFP